MQVRAAHPANIRIIRGGKKENTLSSIRKIRNIRVLKNTAMPARPVIYISIGVPPSIANS